MEKKRTLSSLTGLKGLFIWFIIWFHTAPDTPFISALPGNDFLKIYGGTIGNTMFFILSGFLLSWGYRERILERKIPFPNYLKRRLAKLYPTYFITTLVMILLEILEFGLSGINLRRVAFDLLLQSGGGLSNLEPYNGPGWFVSALFVCYLAYYLITYYSKHDTAYRCAIGLGIAWGYTLLIADWKLPFLYVQNGMAFTNFFVGCALAEIYPYLSSKKYFWLKPLITFVLPASIYLMLRYGVEIISGDSRVAFAFVVCPCILYLAVESNLCLHILESKPVIWLGKISMSLYFWHFVIFACYRWILGFIGINIGNVEYLLYVVILVLWCALPIPRKTAKSKQVL